MEIGSDIEAGGSIRHLDPATGWIVEGRARVLLHHNGDYKEWGVCELVRLDPGDAGRGLSVSVQPVWGQVSSGVERWWESRVALGASMDDPVSIRPSCQGLEKRRFCRIPVQVGDTLFSL